MIPELGHLALVHAFVLAVLLTFVPALGVWRGDDRWMAAARPLAVGQFVFVLLSFAVLEYAFINDDFSVVIVAAQSNSLLPLAYKFSAAWGGHEGSLLLWILILCGWTVAVALFSQSLPRDMLARVLSVMGGVAVGFMGFALWTSNPFARFVLNAPIEGQDLNPLLQDPGMVIHPPMLYFGYVGFSVAFAFAIAALWSGRLDAAWARWTRPWTNIAWAFLTAGIALGSWWAYYELGWGGWWFWDPVENASFMPWLVGTALIHSLAVTEKRGVFRSWTVLLAIFAFSLSLLGTFLVRSGVLTSVHAFAAAPTRGMYILGFLFFVVGGSLTLYGLRAGELGHRPNYNRWAREALLLANNLLFMVAALVVLVGTLFPLIADFAGWGKYSVGPPYFNMMFVPLMTVVLMLMGIGVHSRWKRDEGGRLMRELWPAVVASAVVALLFSLPVDGWSLWLGAGLWLFFWIVAATALSAWQKMRSAQGWRRRWQRLGRAWWGMSLAHIGMAVTSLGVATVVVLTEEQDIRMAVGDRQVLAGYELVFEGIRDIEGPNYVGQQGQFTMYRDGRQQAVLTPEKRRYHARQSQIMTEAAIDAGLMRDIYVALGEPLGEDAWAVRLHYKPGVRWLWLGAIFMALGAVLASADKRYLRRKVRGDNSAPVAKSSTQPAAGYQ